MSRQSLVDSCSKAHRSSFVRYKFQNFIERSNFASSFFRDTLYKHRLRYAHIHVRARAPAIPSWFIARAVTPSDKPRLESPRTFSPTCESTRKDILLSSEEAAACYAIGKIDRREEGGRRDCEAGKVIIIPINRNATHCVRRLPGR